MPHPILLYLYPAVLFTLLLGAGVYAQPTAQLRIQVREAATGQLTPVRVRLTRAGKPLPVCPDQAVAVSYGLWDHADGYAFQPDSAFYVSGAFNLTLSPGTYQLVLSKGNEYLSQTHQLHVRPGQRLQRTYHLKRWINMATRHWYSADGHIHIRRSPGENKPLLTWLQAEDVNVGVLLRMGDFWETYYPQYAFGPKGACQQGNYLLVPGQEDPRTPELGHALGYGATAAVRNRETYYYYDQVFDAIHRRGGLTGYAHQAESFHGYRGLTLDGLRGKVDMLEILQYCVSPNPLRTQYYYHLLELGFPLTATAGSDFPWCGQDHDHGSPEHSAQIGNARFYAYIKELLSPAAWQASVAAGHTFVTSGPILELKVNDALPGDRLALTKGDKVTLVAHAYGHPKQVPLQALELVAHGRVVGRVTHQESGQSASHLSIKLTLDSLKQGQWIAARCYGDSTQAAHTTPVYITVDGGGFHNPQTVGTYLTQSEQYLTELEQELETHRDEPEYRAWYYKRGLKSRIDATRQVISDLRQRLLTP